MGRLLAVHPCPVCNYHIEGELHEGNSGIDTMFLRNHYALAICHACHHLVSVLVPNNEAETQEALREARSNIVQMEADAVIGDDRARYLLPFFRAALDTFDENAPVAVSACTMCGGNDLELLTEVTVRQLDAQDAWVKCPKCDEGRLLIETVGGWD